MMKIKLCTLNPTHVLKENMKNSFNISLRLLLIKSVIDIFLEVENFLIIQFRELTGEYPDPVL